MPPETSPSLPPGGLAALDHLVILIYLACMLAMGLWIARRQKSTEDFFVGGRNLPAWAVGISLMASLLSTITYLGMPGEMFRSGIAYLTRQLGIPLVLIVVWYLWIPFFMRLELTSAYEYLERRFNYATRALASVFCLLLLFGWMAVVVLTASTAMSEIANLDLDWFFGRNLPATAMGPEGEAQINPEDLLDPAALASQFSAARGASEPSPARRVANRLEDFAQVELASLNVNGNPDALRSQLSSGLTQLLLDRDLYVAEDWRDSGVKTPPDLRARDAMRSSAALEAAAETPALSDREVSYLNRLLMEASFPEQIAETHPAYSDADMHAIILSIGLFSILYTTLGGIRAVVWTDVVQFFILMGGALFTMGYVAVATDSGVGDWLAVSQTYKHETVEYFDWDIGNRSTVFSIALGMVFWFICTHGANQVALQRYFTVSGVWPARRSYLVSAISSIALGVMLAGVGISLMYFIREQPLPVSADVTSNVDAIRKTAPDLVFPQFIRYFLPAGLRGLVVAALFAAAMSTIDSGANSVSTMVTVDFARKLNPNITTAGELRLARVLTASMGLIVVAATVFLYHISRGTDFVEICQKGFNCFLGPLGGLFVLGMFARRVTAVAAIPAVVIGEVVGVCTSYSQELFDRPFSTHLVVVTAWLATVVSGLIVGFLLRTEASESQQRWMWLPVVRSKELPTSTQSSSG